MSKMIDPNQTEVRCMPYPYMPTYELSFVYRIGDKATVRGVDFTGVVTGIYIGAGNAISYWIDNGSAEKCYPVECIVPEFPVYPKAEPYEDGTKPA